ncbi:S16 family serine protease [Paenibacillus glycanilyticus]|uniref:Lon proteolytic domain-containing protein n=1 Tax=Paenibacillus glycanilyticus TaxID=126569 RepID=A0ABQ6GLT7_9BACL|nr:S16 family serine protease [Paenibacillus glycanilyticus]GLX71195.1 hypothetical protein MU1_55440 [Paenibacillus glycanilyticus]
MHKAIRTGKARQAAGVLLIAVLLWVVVYAPTPLVIYEPGQTFDTKTLVQLGTEEAQTTAPGSSSNEGEFLITTVKLTDAKYWQVIEAAWKKDFAVYSKDSVMKGMSEKAYLEKAKAQMTSSQNVALEAAYRYAGIAYKVSADGQHIQSDKDSEQITIKTSEIGGPSAGLMFALQSTQLLLDRNLTGGLRIAGTGTINPTGKVGAIGGITFKVAAADKEGAQLFLSPADNYAEAAAKATELRSEMKIIPVTSLESAISAIELASASE